MNVEQRTRVEDRFVQVSGVGVHYQQAGSGRPLVLIHGLVGSARNWRQNITALSRSATVYAIDLVNMGESDRVRGLDAGLEATSDFLVKWMQALGLDEADIVGHSHGGAIAMMLAARHPKRVGKLILFAPANPFCNLGRQLISVYSTRPGQWLAGLIPALPTFVKATMLSRMYGDPARATAESLEGYTHGLAIPGSVEHVLQIVRRWYDDMALLLSSGLPRLASKPVLMIWGDRDRAVGLSSAYELRKLLSQAQLQVIPGVGHIAFEEMPELCNQAILGWLSGGDAAQTTAPWFSMRYPSESLRQLEAV